MCLPEHVRGVRSIMSSTFQAASILTREKPEWDVLREKMRYVMSEFHTGARWTDDAEYRVYAYSKVPMRKTAWRTLFGCKEVLQAEPIRGKFEDYEPYIQCRKRLRARPEEWRIKEWGVCPSLGY
jgi:hypothetical protein